MKGVAEENSWWYFDDKQIEKHFLTNWSVERYSKSFFRGLKWKHSDEEHQMHVFKGPNHQVLSVSCSTHSPPLLILRRPQTTPRTFDIILYILYISFIRINYCVDFIRMFHKYKNENQFFSVILKPTIRITICLRLSYYTLTSKCKRNQSIESCLDLHLN